MENTSTEKIISIVNAQKTYFKSGATLDISFRKEMLKISTGSKLRIESAIVYNRVVTTQCTFAS